VGKVLKDIEVALLAEAEIYTPEGSEPKAVVHQWAHAIAHDLPLFGGLNGAKKEVIIKVLKGKGLFKNKKSFHHELTAKLPIVPPKKARFTFIDLFAGIGGIRIGAQNNGGVCVFSSEFDSKAQETYLDNHGELPFGDITKIAVSDIPCHNVLFAGFPCQPFSHAGLKRVSGIYWKLILIQNIPFQLFILKLLDKKNSFLEFRLKN
jgi:DNA (cytosine-5)-methyltransferase 1